MDEINTRRFEVDYMDKDGSESDVTIYHMDAVIVGGIINSLGREGKKVTAIYEILDGFDKDSLKRMAENNPLEILKYSRLLYKS